MVKALAYTAQLLGVLSAVLVWVLFIPIVDLLTPGTDEHEPYPHDTSAESRVFLGAALRSEVLGSGAQARAAEN